MEGAKSAMYAQAVKNRGWSTVSSTTVEAPAVSQPAAMKPKPMLEPTPEPILILEPMPMPIPMPEPVLMPEPMPMPIPMPEPVLMPEPIPVPMPMPVLMPEPPVIELPDFMKPQEGCQALVMAHVHMQKWKELYEIEQGFHCGTIFAELDLPFMGEGACRHE